MKSGMLFGGAVAALACFASFAPASGLFGDSCGCAAPCGAACDCGCPAPDKIKLRVEIDEQTVKSEKPTKTRKDSPITRKTDDKEVAVTKTIPVQVVDCNGCTHTEYKCVTVMEKVKSTAIDIPPLNPEECTTKTEEKTHQTIRIFIEHQPAGCAAPSK
jgi:hypothetical protein